MSNDEEPPQPKRSKSDDEEKKEADTEDGEAPLPKGWEKRLSRSTGNFDYLIL